MEQIYPIDQKKFRKAKSAYRTGDGIKLSITTTGIGEVIKLIIGGVEYDVTDYSCW